MDYSSNEETDLYVNGIDTYIDLNYQTENLLYSGQIIENSYGLFPNQRYILDSETNSMCIRVTPDNKLMKHNLKTDYCGIQGVDLLQKIALDMMNDYDINMVVCLGSAGTGKGYLSLATLLKMLLHEEVNQVYLIKPMVGVSKSRYMGTLPGSLSEKTDPFLDSFRDVALSLGMSQVVERYLETEKIQYVPIDFIRGRNLDHCILLVDECFDKNSEILTEKGFVKFSNLNETEKVAQYHEDGSISFVEPARYIEKHFKGNMKCVKTDKYYSLTTPNHDRVLLDQNNEIFKQKAHEELKYNYKIPRAGKHRSEKELDHALIDLICMLQADGHANLQKGRYYWQLSFSKPKKIDRIFQICDLLKIKISENKSYKNKRRFYLGRLENLNITKYLSIPDKTFQQHEFLDLNQNSLLKIKDSLIFWDGSNKSGRHVYGTTNLENANFAQAIGHLTGSIASINTSIDNRKESYKNYYRVYFSGSGATGCQKKHISDIPYDDLVYCVEVPSGMIIVRQNGCVSISGNCQNLNRHDFLSVMTRLGRNARMILTGDPNIQQLDIRGESGLMYLLDDMRFWSSPYTSCIHLQKCMRSPIVKLVEDIFRTS